MPGIDELLKEIEGTDVQPKIEALANRCVEKLGMDYNEVMTHFETETASITSRMAEGTPREKILRKAWVRTNGHFKGELLSTAVSFAGIVVGVADKFDMATKPRRIAKEMWDADPGKAVKEGYCDVEGVPLDIRKVFASSGKDNRDYGKPLPEHSFIRNIRGVAKRPDGTLKRFTMALSGTNADIIVPQMVPVNFRANIADDQESDYKLNQWSRIAFHEVGGAPEPDFENMPSLLADQYDQYLCECGGLKDYHARVGGDPQRFVLLNVDIDHVAPEPNPVTKNHMVIVSDDTIDSTQRGITCWVPEHLQPLEGDAGSRAIIGGSTNESEFGDEKVILVNVHSIYFFPEDLVKPMPKEDEKNVQ